MSTAKPTKGHGSRYLWLRSQAVSALVLLGDTEKAAASINVPARTYRAWMNRTDFMEELQTLREQLRAATLAQLTGWMQEAIQGLRAEAMGATKSADRIKAWRHLIVIERELNGDGLKARVEQLEKRLAEMENNGGRAVTINAPEAQISISQDVIASVLAARRDAQQRLAESPPPKIGYDSPDEPPEWKE